MATPTYAECWTMLRNAVWALENLLRDGASNTENLLGHLDDFTQSLEGDYAPEAAAGAENLRTALAGMVSGGFLTDPLLREMAKAINSPARGAQAILTDLYDYMVDNADTVLSRTVVYGTPRPTTAVRSSQTVTFTGTPVANETITINGLVYTFKAARALIGEITINANNTTQAENLVTAVNGSDTVGPYGSDVFASNAAGVVTLTAREYGTKGDVFTLTEAATGTAVGGATFAGGTEATTTGNGQTERLTIDEDGYAIEAVHVDSYTAECVSDGNMGTDEGQEAHRVEGQDAGKDALEIAGSGRIIERMPTMSADTSLLDNASFGSNTVSSGVILATMTSWTFATAIGSHDRSTVVFRSSVKEATAYSLKLKATETISQTLDVAGVSLNPDRPYMLAVRFNADDGSAIGTLVVTFGNATFRCHVEAQVGWHTLMMPLNRWAWPKNFTAADMSVSIAWTKTSGNILLDAVILQEFKPYARTWLAPLTGSTEWLLADKQTWADTIATDSIFQKWFWRLYGRYLPHAASGNTIAEPS